MKPPAKPNRARQRAMRSIGMRATAARLAGERRDREIASIIAWRVRTAPLPSLHHSPADYSRGLDKARNDLYRKLRGLPLYDGDMYDHERVSPSDSWRAGYLNGIVRGPSGIALYPQIRGVIYDANNRIQVLLA